MKKVLLLITLIGSSSFCYSQEMGTLTDARDGKTYKTVKLQIPLEGGIYIERTWMAENLNIKMEGSVCYKNYSAYCAKYGQLYNWEASKTACPKGWHLSTQLEWQEIMQMYGGYQKAGAALKMGGESKLDILMAGFSNTDGKFSDIGKTAHLWDAEIGERKTAGLISLYGTYDEVAHAQISANNMNSCRCVEDYEF